MSNTGASGSAHNPMEVGVVEINIVVTVRSFVFTYRPPEDQPQQNVAPSTNLASGVTDTFTSPHPNDAEPSAESMEHLEWIRGKLKHFRAWIFTDEEFLTLMCMWRHSIPFRSPIEIFTKFLEVLRWNEGTRHYKYLLEVLESILEEDKDQPNVFATAEALHDDATKSLEELEMQISRTMEIFNEWYRKATDEQKEVLRDLGRKEGWENVNQKFP